MSLHHAADPSDEAKPYVEALADVCDHYDVDVESQYATLSDPASKVHYLTAGEGPPLLLLHGLSTNGATWVPMFDALTDHFTVYAPDRPGRGLSTAVDYRETGFRQFGVEYLADLLDALGIEETAVVGNSLGGFQSLALAVDYPERVRRLCLVGAPAGLSRSIPPLFRVLDLPLVGDWLFDFIEAESVADARDAYRRINVEDDSALPDAYFEPGLVAEDLPGQRESLRSLMETLGTMRGMRPQFDLREAVSGIETPTRFVWGTEDYFWSPSVGRPVASTMANADFVTLNDHGHMPWLEPDDDATEAVVEFLSEA
ncbi:alpha/beta fold hydrolase [Halorussus sp. MSC15.2]|uniref:alpha/beta fold hydrolase n=1 Tax=Halorussus sp. MSC15.2 TaxID=2283638 RepID=UPI0013D5165A|nr:alpha/beta fold hydrolase [Halorussus sp. MSC15.2]NEU55464.1 alpha/beta fold hydrolase [Halorussus sp. MSC15.2]